MPFFVPASTEGTQASQHEAQKQAAKNVSVDALNLAGLVSRQGRFRRSCKDCWEGLVMQTQTYRVLQSLWQCDRVRALPLSYNRGLLGRSYGFALAPVDVCRPHSVGVCLSTSTQGAGLPRYVDLFGEEVLPISRRIMQSICGRSGSSPTGRSGECCEAEIHGDTCLAGFWPLHSLHAMAILVLSYIIKQQCRPNSSGHSPQSRRAARSLHFWHST